MKNIKFYLKAHSCVERACLLGMVKCRKLSIDAKFSLRGETLINEIEKDKKEGFFPFYVKFILSFHTYC